MRSQSDLFSLTPAERREYGFLRVRDAAFDAVCTLWKRRQDEGMTQAQVAGAIDGDTGWVSKNLRGPGNWTMKTFGAFVEALKGEVQISIRATEDAPSVLTNYHAYVDYESEIPATNQATTEVNIPVALRAPSGNGSLRGRGPNAVILIP
jgi:hypothetical protein